MAPVRLLQTESSRDHVPGGGGTARHPRCAGTEVVRPLASGQSPQETLRRQLGSRGLLRASRGPYTVRIEEEVVVAATNPDEAVLKGWLATIPRDARSKILSMATPASFLGGTEIMREGDHVGWFGVVVSGRIALQLGVSGRGRVTLETVEVGEGFGALRGSCRHTRRRRPRPPSATLRRWSLMPPRYGRCSTRRRVRGVGLLRRGSRTPWTTGRGTRSAH